MTTGPAPKTQSRPSPRSCYFRYGPSSEQARGWRRLGLVLIYPTAPPAARALPPEELARWAESVPINPAPELRSHRSTGIQTSSPQFFCHRQRDRVSIIRAYGPIRRFPKPARPGPARRPRATNALLEVIRPWLWQAARGFSDPERPDESTADLAQAAWLRAWQSLGQFQGPREGETSDAQIQAMFRAWVLQIVRRLGMNSVRDRKAEHRQPPGQLQRLDAALPGPSTAPWGHSQPETAEPSPSGHAEANEQAKHIREALDRLADYGTTQIVRLRFLEGLSLRQIAAKLSRNHEHIRQPFHAALRLLEHDLEDLR